MAKFLVSLPDDLFAQFEEYRNKNHYERTELIKGLIRAAIAQDLSILPSYTLNENGRFAPVVEVPTETPSETPKKLPPMDDWGNVIQETPNPSFGPSPARAKLDKIAKSLKTDDKCPHGIAKGGYCKACGGLAK